MSPVNLTGPQMSDLAASMLALTTENGNVVDNAPEFAADGAALYQKSFCGTCHIVNGVGGKIGPVLNGLASRRTEAWTVEHFQQPQRMSPGTSMPPYQFSGPDMQNIVSYLFTLPDKMPAQ